MEFESGNQERQLKTYALTSENLKKFEEQLKRSGSSYGRRKVPRRTAGDGRSEKQSAPSLQSDLKLEVTEEKNEFRKSGSRARRSLYRPERDAVRRNPEGRSQNAESIAPRPVSGKTIHYDETDNRIPYENPSHVTNLHSRASQMSKHEIIYETSSASSSTITQIRTKNIRREPGSTEGSISTSTSAGSDDDVFDDDDFISADSSDDSHDDQATTMTKHATTFNSSSVSSGSVSSIPTHPSRQENSAMSVLSPMMKPLETSPLPSLTPEQKQIATKNLAEPSSPSLGITEVASMTSLIKHSEPSRPPGSRKTKASPKSSKNLSKQPHQSSRATDEVSLKSLKTGVEESVEESSISSWSVRDTISRGTTSRKDSLTSIDSGRVSYVTIRNWSRWSRYTAGGYSITDKILPLKRRIPRRDRSKSSESSLVSSSPSESSRSESVSSATSSRSASRSASGFRRSITNLNLAKDPRPLPLDDYDPSVKQTDAFSKISNLELNLQLRPNSTFVETNTTNYRGLTSKVKVRKETENDVYGFDFKYRTKKIPKLRDRPKRSRKQSTAGAVSNQRSHQFSRTRRRRRKGRGAYVSSIKQDDQSVITLSSYTASLRRKAASSVSVATASSRRKVKSSVSMTTESTASRSTSSASSSDPRARRKNNQLRPLNVDDSGFITDGSPSSCASIRPAETPFTPALGNRYANLQSVVSEYSSYHSIYRSSSNSQRSASSLSVSSHSDEESTANGPQLEVAPQKHHPQPKLITKPKQPVIEEREEEILKTKTPDTKDEQRIKLPFVTPIPSPPRRKSSPYFTSLSPAIAARMKVLRKAIKNAKLADQRQKKHERVHKVFRMNHPMPSYEDAYRDHGMPRLIKLARPKESKAVWATSFWPVRWGDQSMVFPLSKSAMRFKGTPRLEQLAISKKDFRKDHPEMCARDAFQFSCGRSSVVLEVSPFAMKTEASSRVIELAKHKTTMQAFEDRAQRNNYIFSCGRTSPIWSVNEGAKTAEERERTMNLAHPKKNHPHYQQEKSCIWPVSSAARRTSPSPRVERLARPKTRSDGLHREPTWIVPPSAMRTVASARVQELAKPKQTAEGYEHCRELDEPLPKSVLRATATDRIKSLSKPVIRETMDHVQFNPDAFKVSPAALKGRMPDRIADLARK